MKKGIYFISLLIIIISHDGFAQHHGYTTAYNDKRKEPAIAALLSIQPLPFAFGNFYTGNWARGIIYTTAELALFIPGAILLSRNDWGRGMHDFFSYRNERRTWTNNERSQFYYLLAGYTVLKIVSAFDAGYSAEIYNQNLSVGYNAQTNTAILTLSIPIN